MGGQFQPAFTRHEAVPLPVVLLNVDFLLLGSVCWHRPWTIHGPNGSFLTPHSFDLSVFPLSRALFVRVLLH